MIPVIVGGDIGAYGLARAFHEHFGVHSIVVARIVTRAFAHSRIATVKVADVEDPKALLQALQDVAAEHQGERLVLLTNADWYVQAIIDNREALQTAYEIPLCSAQAFAAVSSKERFQADCEELGIRVPRTVAINPARSDPAQVRAALADLPLPVIGKPSSSAEHHYVNFPSKRKIHHLDTVDECVALVDQMRAANVDSTFLFQEFVPGDETHMRSLTAYRDSRGAVTMMVTGQVLLEEHTPATLGVPAAILTTSYPDAFDAMERYLHHIDYRGFANADFKHNAATGEHVFFEVNPRIGRNNYYATAAGINPAVAVMADLDGANPTPQRGGSTVLYSVVPLTLLRRYLPERVLRREVMTVARRALARPLHYRRDWRLKRALVVWALTLNYWRKYLKHYPRPTATGY